MNSKLEEFKNNIEGKKVAVIGIGISNAPLIRFLIKYGADVTGFDKKSKDDLGEIYNNLNKLGCRFCLGENYLSNLVDYDYIFRTPGMRYDTTELEDARKNGAVITSEMELFFELCPCQTFAVTGSDGKTTTTTLIYLMLKDAGYTCWLGGNIGAPLIDKIEEIGEYHKVVLELSSFQLHTMKKSPNIAVITNVTPNHLDYHKSMDEYILAKESIFSYQHPNDKLVLNYDNDITRSFQKRAKGETVFFSRVNELKEGIMVQDEAIIKRDENDERIILKVNDIKLPGAHNVENYLAAICAVYDFVEIENIYNIATTFGGVEHRIEFVREIDGIKFYNDSIGSSPTRTTASIMAFKEKVILIAGGYDKKIPFDDFGPVVVQKVKKLFLMGKTTELIAESVLRVSTDYPIVRCTDLVDAVNKAYQSAEEGDIVILSPACASFDMYKNFEERGRHFKEIVNSL